MRHLRSDVRLSWRALARQPGFTAVSVLTLALAIGASTAIFSAIEGMLLRPLPYREPDRLVFLTEDSKAFPGMSISPLDLKDWQARNSGFDGLSGYRRMRYVVSGAGEAEFVLGAQVNASLFFTLGVAPIAGRTLLADEDRPGGRQVVVVGEGFAVRHFGSARRALGQRMTVNGSEFAVIGVMPASFRFPAVQSELWTSIAPTMDTDVRGNHPGIAAVGRLKPGVSFASARSDMAGIATQLEHLYPDANRGTGVLMMPLTRFVVDDSMRGALWLLAGAAAFVLLIACANVINLMLARAAGRGREIAVRTALGATRSRVAAMLATESLLISVAGGLLGVLVAAWGVRAIVALVPAGTPRATDVHVDAVALLFAVATSVAAGLLVGVAPAWQAARLDPSAAMKEGGRSDTTGPGRTRLRGTLVVAEMTLSLVLLIGAGLLVGSFLRVVHANPGLDPTGVETLQLSFTSARYTDAASFLSVVDPLLARIKALPGVEAAGAVSPLPLSGAGQFSEFAIEGRPPRQPGDELTGDYAVASPDYFTTMRIPLVRGRFFTEADLRGDAHPVIVDDALARRDFPGEDPVGRRLSFGGGPFDPARARTIVGVVGHVMNYGVDEAGPPVAFEPAGHVPFGALTLVIRTGADPTSIVAAVREEVARLDPAMPLFNVAPMTQVMGGLTASRRLSATLLGGFSVLALVLAAVGIYSVIANGVAQRTREIGLRMALGSGRAAVLRLIVGEGLRLSATGVAFGWLGAWALRRVIADQLYGVGALDVPTFTAMAAALVLVALVGSWIPARRAAGIDPLIALRSE